MFDFDSISSFVLYFVWAALVIAVPWITFSYRNRQHEKHRALRKQQTEESLKLLLGEQPEPQSSGHRKPPENPKPEIVIGHKPAPTPTEENMGEASEEKSLLERYAEARHDIEMLTMMLHGMAQHQDHTTMTAQQSINRAIILLERESEDIKAMYEENGQR